MIPLSAVKDAATILGIAIPVLVEALKAVQCAVEDCDVALQPADAPDLLRRAQENRARLAAKAAGLARPTQSAFGDAKPKPGDYDG